MIGRLAIAIAIIAVGAGLAAATPQGLGAPVTFSYAAPATCPTAADFESAVRARIEAEPTTSVAISLVVTSRADGFDGELSVTREGAAEARRALGGQSCGDVVTALALIAALALNSAEPSAPALPVSPPPRVPIPGRASLPRAPAAAPGRSWHGLVGADAGIDSGIAPNVAPSGALFAELASVAASVVQPSIRVAVAAETATATNGGDSARFTWLAGELGACPVRLELGSVAIEPCLRVEIGALHARGAGVSEPLAATRFWLAPAVTGRLTWQLARRAAIELEVGPVVPLWRDRYFFPPDTTIHQVPAASVTARVGVAVDF